MYKVQLVIFFFLSFLRHSYFGLILVFASIRISHQSLNFLQVRHSRWSWHILEIIPEGCAIPPYFVLVQRIHDHRCIDVGADLDHLAMIPACEPDIGDIELVACNGSASQQWMLKIGGSACSPEFITPLN